MVKTKRLIPVLLVFLLACHHPNPNPKNESSDNEIPISDSLSIGIPDIKHHISAFPWEGKRVFVLPGSWSLDSLTAFYFGEPVPIHETHRILMDTNIRIEHSRLPALFIAMEEKDRDSIYNDKSQVADALISLFLPDGTNEYEGKIRIKTRGNSSWAIKEKKPFTIKLNQSTRLLDLEKGKSFTLLNNITDNALIRNALAFRLANALGIFAPKFNYVTLYFNGDYKGIYQMTNKIEVSRRSIDIVDLEKENKRVNDKPLDEYPTFSIGELTKKENKKGVRIDNPDDITGGYRLDNNGESWIYSTSVSGFISSAGDPIKIKSPKHASFEQVEYISDFYDKMESAVMNPSGINPKTGRPYFEYLDIESFARYFLLQEITQNPDGGWCSFMMYKDAGTSSKMKAGPAWDFDRAMKRAHSPMRPFNILWTCSKMTMPTYSPLSGGLFYYLWQHKDFQQVAKQIFLDELFNYVKDSTNILDYTDSLVTILCQDSEFERMRHPKFYRTSNFQEATDSVSRFLLERNDFLHWLWTTDSSEMVAIPLIGDYDPRKSHFQKEITLYGNKTNGVTLPEIPRTMTSYRDPVFLGYFVLGTDIPVDENKPLLESQSVEIRWDYPNWFEAQYRRVKNKLRRMFKKEQSEQATFDGHPNP